MPQRDPEADGDSADALEDAERKTKVALVAAVTATLLTVPRGKQAAVIPSTARRLNVTVRQTLVQGRDAARAASRATVVPKAAAEAVPAVIRRPPAVTSVYRGVIRELDEKATAAPARNFAREWQERVTTLVSEGQGVGRSMREAAASLRSRLQTQATTEVAIAFSDERARIASEIVTARPQLAAAMVKVWNASLDGATCRVCSDLDGTEVELDGDFPGGLMPGHAHPCCRCFLELSLAKGRRAA